MSAFKDLLMYVKNKNFSKLDDKLVNEAKREIETKEEQWKRYQLNKKIKFEKFTIFLEAVKLSNWNTLALTDIEKEFSELHLYLSMVQKMKMEQNKSSALEPVTLKEQHTPCVHNDVIEEQGPDLSYDVTQTTSGYPLKTTSMDATQTTTMDATQTTTMDATQTTTMDATQTTNTDATQTTVIDATCTTNMDAPRTTDDHVGRITDVKPIRTTYENVINVKNGHAVKNLDLPNMTETRSIYSSLFISNDYRAVASEYCKLFNKDREEVYQCLVDKHGKGKAESAEYMFKLLEGIYIYTSEIACKQIGELVNKTKEIVAGKTLDDYKVKDEHIDILRQFRRFHGTVALSSLSQGYRIQGSKDIERSPEMNKFIAKCLELSWCICTHDPPMSLDFKTKFDNQSELLTAFNSYKHGQHGHIIHCPLWPPLRLSTTGPILVKGFAHLY